MNMPANEIPKLKPIYNGCTAFGLEATVSMGSCTYNFDTPNATYVATVDVVCTSNANVNGNTLPNTGDVRIRASVLGQTCEVHIESQNNKSNVTFEDDNPEPGKVRVVAALTGITAEKVTDNGLCPLNNVGTVNNATYNGLTDLIGTEKELINIEVA